MSDEQRYFDALKTIARDYMTSEELRHKGPKQYGLSFEEVLEMSYDNLQQTANDAIKGKRRPRL